MGTWSVSIMGNDLALDLKEEFKNAFAFYSVNDAIVKLDEYYEQTLDEDEKIIYYYSLAFFMWEYGILTQEVKERAINFINNKKGLELFAEQGKSVLKRRELVLENFKEKLNSILPSRKKISIEPNTIFELGDMIALKLSNKYIKYLFVSNDKKYRFEIKSEDIEKYNGYYVVVKKIYDTEGISSVIVPEIKDGLPVYVLYDYLNKKLPNENDIKKMKILDVIDDYDLYSFIGGYNIMENNKEREIRKKCILYMKCAFKILNKKEFYWKKRDYKIIGNNLSDCLEIIEAIKKSMEHMDKWKKERIRKDFHSPCAILHMSFDQIILRRLKLKSII